MDNDFYKDFFRKIFVKIFVVCEGLKREKGCKKKINTNLNSKKEPATG